MFLLGAISLTPLYFLKANTNVLYLNSIIATQVLLTSLHFFA